MSLLLVVLHLLLLLLDLLDNLHSLLKVVLLALLNSLNYFLPLVVESSECAMKVLFLDQISLHYALDSLLPPLDFILVLFQL